MKQNIFCHKGSILVITMMFMVVLLVLVTAIISTIGHNMNIASSQYDKSSALYLADAGVNKAIYYLNNTAPDGSTNGSWRTNTYPGGTPNSSSAACSGSNPCQEPLYVSSGVNTFGVYPTANSVIGYYTIWLQVASDGNTQIISKGTYNGLSRTVSVEVSLPGPLLWWTMDDDTNNTNVADSSGNDYKGTATANTSTLTTAGKINGALNFNGSSNYVLSPSLGTPPQSTTFSVWINSTTSGGVVFSELAQSAINSGWHDSQIEVETNGTVKTCVWTNTLSCVNATTGLGYNAWHNIVLTYNASSHVLTGYYDGTAGASSTVTRQYPSTLYYGIGATDSSNAGNGSYFKGSIDDVRVYNYALSAGEVSQVWTGSNGNNGNGADGVALVSAISGTWKEL